MERRGLVICVACALANAVVAPLRGQAPVFETVSVKPNTSGDGRMSAGARGRTYSATNAPLVLVIAEAYGLGLQRDRLVGGPDWISTGADRFDIVATMPEGSDRQQLQPMLQAMLAERFHLSVHRETRDAPMYAMVVARSDGRLGARLRKAAIDCEALRAAGQPLPVAATGQEPSCSAQISDAILGRGQRLTALARMLTQFAGREVVDRTGLPGGYDFDLVLPSEASGRRPPAAAAASAPDDPAGGIFTVLQDELGLKLVPTRGPLEFVVIDRIERPSSN